MPQQENTPRLTFENIRHHHKSDANRQEVAIDPTTNHLLITLCKRDTILVGTFSMAELQAVMDRHHKLVKMEKD